MRWNNPTHECDEKYVEYEKMLKRHHNQIWIFGAGLNGGICYRIAYIIGLCVKGFIDNDVNRQGQSYYGRKIIHFSEYAGNKDDGLIVVCVARKNVKDVELQLQDIGMGCMQEYVPFNVFFKYMVPVVSLYENGKLFLPMVQLSLTERCTLKCKKCAHGCGESGVQIQDMEFEKAMESIDSFFQFVDCVQEFYLIGGETLLYRDLERVVRYCGQKYRDRMDTLSITTNGTIYPSAGLLRTCQRYGVLFRISNYSLQIPSLKKKYDSLSRVLEDGGIQYYLGEPEKQWIDYGYDYVNRNGDIELTQEVFDHCSTLCREIRGSKFYYCIQARAVSENKISCEEADKDYFELSVGIEKRKLLEYSLGYSEKGYLSMCNYCNGDSAFTHPIPAAEQNKEKK